MARPSHYHTTSGLTAMPSMPAFQRGHSVWGYPGLRGSHQETQTAARLASRRTGKPTPVYRWPCPPCLRLSKCVSQEVKIPGHHEPVQSSSSTRVLLSTHTISGKSWYERERDRTHAFCAPRTQVQKSERTQVLPFNLLCTLSSLTYRPSPHHCPPPHGFPLASGCVF